MEEFPPCRIRAGPALGISIMGINGNRCYPWIWRTFQLVSPAKVVRAVIVGGELRRFPPPFVQSCEERRGCIVSCRRNPHPPGPSSWGRRGTPEYFIAERWKGWGSSVEVSSARWGIRKILPNCRYVISNLLSEDTVPFHSTCSTYILLWFSEMCVSRLYVCVMYGRTSILEGE
jgi:hypothetical protein